MDFANADIPKSIGTTSLAWDLVQFIDEDFFPPIIPRRSTLKIWNGSAYVEVTLKRYNGTSWQDCSVKLFKGSVWE